MDHPTCQKCHLPVLPEFFFCPNCGTSLRPKPLSTSVVKQIGIYLLSLLLPPLGLWPGVKYFLQKDPKAKIVGLVAIGLTVISTIMTFYYASVYIKQFTNEINGQINGQLNNQMNSEVQKNLNQIP